MAARVEAAIWLTCFGPEGVDGDAVGAELFGHAEDAHGHAVLGHGVGHVVAEPARVHVERRAQGQDGRGRAALQVRQGRSRP